MKLSTIFKVAAAVATVCTAGVVIYEVTKKREEEIDTINVTELVDGEESEDADVTEVTGEETVIYPVVKKITRVAIGCAAVLLALPLASELAYRRSVTKLAVDAIDKGGLTLEQLTELARGMAKMEEGIYECD